jgi:uncharacterized phage protein (TIGR02218 family)
MKRLVPASLIAFWQANPNCLRADLFTILLPNGQTITATSGQFDLTIPAGTPGWTGSTTAFSASAFGVWSRGAITSEATFDLTSNTMELTCVPQQSTAYPGLSIGLLGAALNSLFDAAEVTVQTAYMPMGNYGNVSAGIETKFVGQITSINDLVRNKIVFEAADYLYLLNLKIPTRLIQSNCPWAFADANCQLTPATFTTDFTAAAGTTTFTMTPGTAFTQPAGYYTQGVVTCLTGANAGLSQAVKLHDSSGNLQTMYPWLLAPNVGDTFAVIAGCDKSAGTCTTKFNNLIHMGGQPFCPVPQSSI